MSSVGTFSLQPDTVNAFTQSWDSNTAKLESQLEILNEHQAIISAQICKWAPPTYGDAGVSAERDYWRAAIIAVATLNTIAQARISDKRYEIAEAYQKLAEDQWNRFKNDYVPFEQSYLYEASNQPKYNPDYIRARNSGVTNATDAFLFLQNEFAGMAKAFALCPDESLLNAIDNEESVSASDGANFNYRDEENFALIKDDQRWNRRSSALNLGRELQALSATYAQNANTQLAELSGVLNEGAQGAMQILGYFSARRATQYPSQYSMASPFEGPSSNMGRGIVAGPSS